MNFLWMTDPLFTLPLYAPDFGEHNKTGMAFCEDDDKHSERH